MGDATRIAAWSVKGVDRATRDLARQASQAAGQTIGGWIEQAIRAQDTLLPAGLPSGGAAFVPVAPAEDAAAASPASPSSASGSPVDVRSLEQEVQEAESRAGDLVIPVALRVQQLAQRLIDIEQARVDGRPPAFDPGPPETKKPEPAKVAPDASAEDAGSGAGRVDLPEETRFSEDAWSDPPPETWREGKQEITREESWDAPPLTPSLTWNLDPEPGSDRDGDRKAERDPDRLPTQDDEPLTLGFDDRPLPPPVEEPPPVFELETPAPALSQMARARKPPRRARTIRAAIGQALAASVAIALGAATAIILLNEGKRLGLPPHLDVEIARRIDQGLAQGRALWSEGGDLASSWAERVKAELDRLMAEAPPAPDPSAGLQSSGGPPPGQQTAGPQTTGLQSSGPPPAEPPAGPPPSPPNPAPSASPEAPPSPPAAAIPDPTPDAARDTTTATRPPVERPEEAPAALPVESFNLPPAAGPIGDPPPASGLESGQTAVLPPPSAVETTPEQALGDTKREVLTPEPAATAAPQPSGSAAVQPPGSGTIEPANPASPAREPEALEKAGRQGDVAAQYELGVLAAQPESGSPDYGKAAYWFREAAVQGNASAQYNLGVLYEHGMGVGQDDVRALLWYHSAAEQGHSRAQYNLGVFYAQGRGIPTDYPEAQRWFKKAADQGVAKAFYNLAILAESGLGAPANPSAAKAYMSRAALLGDPQARAALTGPPKAAPARPEATTRGPSAELVGAIQHLLSEQGYEIGRIDGVLGDRTRQAIRKFQAENGLGQTGTPSDELLDLLSRRVERDTATARTPS
jgi:hypothetical protein